MPQAERAPDPLARDLEVAHSLYVQLAARVAPSQQTGVGLRTPAASRPPLNVDMVSHMAALEQALGWWISTARWLLDPVGKVDLTAREGVRCPYCAGDLVAYLRVADPDAAEVVCTSLEHPAHEPRRWAKADWPRLGVLAGVHADARYGPRLRSVGDP